MDTIDTAWLLAHLKEDYCELNHGPGTLHDRRSAVDYIIQPFVYTQNNINDIAVREMIVPVCADCLEDMQGSDWALTYCIECCSSQWVYKKFVQNQYRNNILWLRGCTECGETADSMHAADIKGITGNPLLMSKLSQANAA